MNAGQERNQLIAFAAQQAGGLKKILY